VFFNGQIQPNFSLFFSFLLFGRQRVANAQSCRAPIAALQVIILNERCNLNTSSGLRPKAEILSETEGEGSNWRSLPSSG